MKMSKAGFTIIEVLVVITIIAILAGLLLPALNRFRASAKETECRNNVRQLTQAMLAYVNSYNGAYPAYYKAILPDDFTYDVFTDSWLEAMFKAHAREQLELDPHLLSCAMRPEVGAIFSGSGLGADYDGSNFPYAYNVMVGGAGNDRSNGRGVRASMIHKPDMTVVFYEAGHNLGAASQMSSPIEFNWQIKDSASLLFSPLQSTISNLVDTIANNSSLYLPHGSSQSMVIGMADGSVSSMSIDMLKKDRDEFTAINGSYYGFGSIWDNIKPER